MMKAFTIRFICVRDSKDQLLQEDLAKVKSNKARSFAKHSGLVSFFFITFLSMKAHINLNILAMSKNNITPYI